jgi:L-fucose mutarotase/ribose pyranase (RbsD/FucU family)
VVQHWAWAIDEVLRKQGDVGCDAIVVLDPNFPAWSSMDRVAAWDGPQMAKAMGAPFCMMYPMIKLMMGMMQSQAKWDTAAARDKTTSGSIAQMGAGVDLYEDMMARHAG